MKKIAVLLLCLLPMCLQAQQINVDSLINVLDTTKPIPTEQLALYYKIYNTYVAYDLGKASEYAEKGLALAEKENNKLMSSKFNAAFGRIYNTKSSYDTALVYWRKALDFAIEVKDKGQEASVYLGTGVLYARQEKFVPALEYFIKALSIYENAGEKQKSITTMSNIASMYRTMENDEKAIYYLEKARKLAEEIDDAYGKMTTSFELGAIYHRRANIDDKKEDVKQALDYELKAYEISHKLNDKNYQGAITQALAAIYSNYLKDDIAALKYAGESLQVAREIGDPKMIIAALNAISSSYLAQKCYKECNVTALEAWQIDSTDINMGSDLLINIILSNIALGKEDNAKQFFGKYRDLVRRHIDQSNREIMADMEAKYETEKKEMRIAALEKEQKLYYGLGAAIVIALLLGIGLLFYRHRTAEQKRKIAEQQIKQLEQEKELMEQEKKLIETRSVLDAEKKEREIIARDLHDEVGTMLSVVKNNMDIYSKKSYSIIENTEIGYFKEAVSVLEKAITGLRRIAHHIMPAILIEKGLVAALEDFCRSIPEAEFHLTGNERRFDSEKELVMYRCAYELVNNAMRHAKASCIDIHLNMDEKTVYLSVVDNGCGFDPQTTPSGMGMENLRTRLSTFGGNMDIYSEQGKGTEVNVELLNI
ncbi:MAG: tetratricopeptide repeat protein [Candidatus Azobacteroides sp.]|nr:tetratricopeptide repeat protein [Candidatus Azobacteroides sp.]